MNHHSEKERSTSVPTLCRITLQNAPYKDYKLLMLMSFEATTVTSIATGLAHTSSLCSEIPQIGKFWL